ncbi:hypothetical protein [Bacillus sp. AK031]
MKTFVMVILAVSSLLATACSHSEPIISEETAKSIIIERYSGSNGNVKILSVSHKNNEYTVKWEIKENCESGTDILDDETGEVKRGETSIC